MTEIPVEAPPAERIAAAVAALGEAEVNHIRDLIKEHGDDWKWRFLNEKGVNYARYL